MSLFLKELEIWSDNKKGGWTSGVLPFGNKFTYVAGLGENTCGKTPILKSIMFALGVDENFRADIMEKSSGVRLRAIVGGNDLTFERRFSEKDTIKIKDNNSKIETSYKVEKESSPFIFEKLGYPNPSLTGSSGNATILYFSTIAPLFWKAQIDSWHTIYSEGFSYIKDQRKEATRFILGLAPLNPYGINSEIKKNKKNVGELTEAISDRNSLIEELKKIFNTSDDIDLKSLETEKNDIKSRLRNMENDFSTVVDATKDFDSAISSLAVRISEARKTFSDKSSRVMSLKHVIREVDAEVETLTLNDEAADRFRNLNQICNNQQCGMFLTSKESYGKSLVYLKEALLS